MSDPNVVETLAPEGDGDSKNGVIAPTERENESTETQDFSVSLAVIEEDLKSLLEQLGHLPDFVAEKAACREYVVSKEKELRDLYSEEKKKFSAYWETEKRELLETLSEWRTETAATLGRLEEKLDAATTSVGEVSDLRAVLDGFQRETGERLKELKTSFSSYGSLLSEQCRDLSVLKTVVESSAQTLNATSEDLREARTVIELTDASVGDVADVCRGFSSRLDGLYQSLSDLSKAVSLSYAEWLSNASRLASRELEARLLGAELETAVSELSARLLEIYQTQETLDRMEKVRDSSERMAVLFMEIKPELEKIAALKKLDSVSDFVSVVESSLDVVLKSKTLLNNVNRL